MKVSKFKTVMILMATIILFISGCSIKKEEQYITIKPADKYERMADENKVEYPAKLKFNYSLPKDSPLYTKGEYYTLYCSGSCAAYRVEKTGDNEFKLLEGRLKGKLVKEAFKMNNDYVGLFHFEDKKGTTEIEVKEYRELRKVLIAISNKSMWSQLVNKY